MKKIITLGISIYLLTNFLIYAGVFRNNSDPVEIVRYYYECMKNREWPLTYQIYNRKCFNEAKIIEEGPKYNLASIDKIKLYFLGIKDNYAYVRAEIVYKDKHMVKSTAELERSGRAWLVRDIKYD